MTPPSENSTRMLSTPPLTLELHHPPSLASDRHLLPREIHRIYKPALQLLEQANFGSSLFSQGLRSSFDGCRIEDDSHISVNGKSIRIVSSRNPLELPWKEMVSVLDVQCRPYSSMTFLSHSMEFFSSSCLHSNSLHPSQNTCMNISGLYVANVLFDETAGLMTPFI